MNPDYRWDMIQRLNHLGVQTAEKLAQAELKKDPSELSQKNFLASMAVQPKMKVKKEYYEKLTKKKSTLSLARKKAILWSLFPPDQRKLHDQFTEDYYSKLPQLVKAHSEEFLSDYAEAMAPKPCDPRGHEQLKNYLESHKDFPYYVTKELKIALDEDSRCQHITEFARSGQVIHQ